ncbi:MAG TPA: class I SAM-dependent methyltransferase [Nitrospirota bacterium]|nr:class I SAM-dependent methyltransferase [Nitrospirota bacterium]
MAGVDAFDRNVDRYEQWFLDHPLAYVSELHAVRELLPGGTGVEIGVGTGRFAAPLGITRGIEPSAAMASLAREKRIDVVPGVAEKLPYQDREFDFALMVTTVCFLDDPDLAFQEVHRVLKPGGSFVVGFVDSASQLGREYAKHKEQSAFYKDATFYSAEEIEGHLTQAGFGPFEFRQTLFKALDQMESVDPVKRGQGEGSFVVVRGVRK